MITSVNKKLPGSAQSGQLWAHGPMTALQEGRFSAKRKTASW